jgi:HK97 family phage prohead protease
LTELRAETGKSALRIEGIAVPYNMRTEIRDEFGVFDETIAPGAASDVLSRKVDTRFLIGHDSSSVPLGRSSAKTLRLWETERGLHLAADLDPESQRARDLASAIKRGDITGLSISFGVTKGFDDWNSSMTSRVIRRFSMLPEISSVAFPAYPTTTLTARSVALASAHDREQAELELELLRLRARRPLGAR